MTYVGITSTIQRPLAEDLILDWTQYTPINSSINVVYDDMENPKGVAHQKNELIEAFLASDKQHLFLVDDDIRPLSLESTEQYINAPGLHYCLSFRQTRLKEILPSGEAVYSWPNGVLLYIHRSVIEKVGFMREDMGKFGREHVEYSQRIAKALGNPYPFLDVSAESYKKFEIFDMNNDGHLSNISDSYKKTQLFAEARRLSKAFPLKEGQLYVPRMKND